MMITMITIMSNLMQESFMVILQDDVDDYDDEEFDERGFMASVK